VHSRQASALELLVDSACSITAACSILYPLRTSQSSEDLEVAEKVAGSDDVGLWIDEEGSRNDLNSSEIAR
jgi:hypothetical protein